MKFWQQDDKQTLLVYTFDTVSEVLRFERECNKAGLPVTLRPVPRSLSSSCGTCAALSPDDADAARALIEEKQLSFHSVHTVEE